MIEFRNVTKSYGDFTAVEDISFSACDSSVCGLIGYNGAGKTTLIKCAAGLYKPDSGKVLIDGESTYNSDEVRSRLFFVPDDLFFPVGSTPNSAARFYKDYYPEFSFGNFERMLKLFELDGRRENTRIFKRNAAPDGDSVSARLVAEGPTARRMPRRA